MSDTDQIRKNQRKGERTEQEANRIVNMAYRRSDRVSRYGNNDPLHLADILAIRKGWPVLFVQVKANQPVSPSDYHSYAHSVIDAENAEFEVWNREDYYGWHIHRFDPDADPERGKLAGGLKHVLDIPETDYKPAGKIYREHVQNRLD